MPARFVFAFLSLLCTASLLAGTGDVQLPVISNTGALTPVLVTKTPNKVLGWDNSGTLGPITVASDWSSITGKPTTLSGYGISYVPWSTIDGETTPTTLSGYGITDSITAATAASTYQPIIGNGTLPLAKLAVDPLARANHTGTQAWSTITGTPTTLSGYGITDAATTIVVPGTAWVMTSGNDETGVVSNPQQPFQTLQAAHAAGARVFVVGVGTFAGISGITDDISLIGCGASKTIIGDISGTSGNITGNGRTNITVGGIYIIPPNGTGSSIGNPYINQAAQDGSNGNDAPNVTVSGLTSTDNVIVAGHDGYDGAYGGDTSTSVNPLPGGNGGNGGAAGTLTIQDCILAGYAVSYAGNGGNGGQGSNYIDNGGAGGAGGNGGNAGAAGAIIIHNSTVGGMYSAAANGGNPGAGGNGSDTGASGAAGAGGAAGTVTTYFTRSLSGLSSGETQAFWVSLINGTFYSD